MTLKSIFEEAIADGRFSIEAARRAIRYDWRSMIGECSGEAKREAETLFYFIEGYVEEVDEGFVVENNDPELYERARQLLPKL